MYLKYVTRKKYFYGEIVIVKEEILCRFLGTKIINTKVEFFFIFQ